MAKKFATVLCILLLACGTQGVSISDLMSEVTTQIQALMDQIGSLEAKLIESMNNATNASNSFNNFVSQTAQNASVEYTEAIEDLATAATPEKVATCAMSATYDFGTITVDIISSVGACTIERITELQSEYNSILTSLQELTTRLTSLSTSAVKCSSNMFTAILCLTKLLVSATVDIPRELATVAANVASLVIKLANFQSDLTSCSVISIVQTLIEDAGKSYSAIEQCVLAQ